MKKDVISKKIERRGNKWCIIYCSGSDAGKVYRCYDTREQALRVHRAIMANKEQKSIEKNGRPPKEWFYRCVRAVSQAPGVSTPEALCGWIYYHHAKIKPKISDIPLMKELINEIKKEEETDIDVIDQIAILKGLKKKREKN